MQGTRWRTTRTTEASVAFVRTGPLARLELTRLTGGMLHVELGYERDGELDGLDFVVQRDEIPALREFLQIEWD